MMFMNRLLVMAQPPASAMARSESTYLMRDIALLVLMVGVRLYG